MLRFNLIPPELRARFVLSQKLKYFSLYGNLVIGLLAAMLLFLSFVLIYLQRQQASFAQELFDVRSNPQNITIEAIKQRSAGLNEELRGRQEDSPSVDWYQFLTFLADIVPPDIVIRALIVESNEPTSPRIVLEGEAADRSALRTFENELRASPFVRDVLSPLSNYQEKEDLMFRISFTFIPSP